MGQIISCNDKWSEMVFRLQHSADVRRKKRNSCTCINRRPRCLRIRRKIRHKKCHCSGNSTQERIPVNIDTIACSSPQYKCHSKCMKVQPKPNLCSRGTNTCCLQTYNREIHGIIDENRACGPVENIGKNVCRFTVDAYFM